MAAVGEERGEDAAGHDEERLVEADGRVHDPLGLEGHDYIGHNYIGHNYIGHNYIGHNYIGHDEERLVETDGCDHDRLGLEGHIRICNAHSCVCTCAGMCA